MMRWTCLVVGVVLAGANVLVAEEAKTGPGVTKEEAAQGFVSLFDGKTLDGWQGSTKGYVAKDGVLICEKKGGRNLMTKKEYANFIFRFEFKLEPGGNNGIGIRAPLRGSASSEGMEIQILDHDHSMYKGWLQPYQRHGSVYGVVPAQKSNLKPVGEWNSEEILCDGPHIKVTLNGMVINDADLSKVEKPADGHEHPGIKRKTGYLGFLGHDSRVEFRNIRIKEL